MLSPAEQDLIRRDPGLPGLGTMLDEAALLQALGRALPDLPAARADLQYLRYKPGTNAVAGYRLSLPGGPLPAYAKTFGPADQPKVLRDLRRAAAHGLAGTAVAAFDDGATLVRVFPNDASLPALPALTRMACGEEAATGLGLGRGQLHELRYKPERRWVGRFDPDHGGASLVLKLHAPARFAAALAGACAFRDSGPLRLAPLRWAYTRRRLLGFGWLPGLLLSQALQEGSATAAMLHTVGRALARLHRQDATNLPTRSRAREVASLQATAAGIAWLLPSEAARVAALTSRLTARLAAAPEVARPTHGDFYAKQVLVDGEGAGVLDLDSAVLADPAQDLGLFLAHLERDHLRGFLSGIAHPGAAFLAGYRDEAGTVPARVPLYVASALLRLAPDPFRHREPQWERRTTRLLERAEALAVALEGEVAA